MMFKTTTTTHPHDHCVNVTSCHSIQTNIPDVDSITNTSFTSNANETLFLFQKTATGGLPTHLNVLLLLFKDSKYYFDVKKNG